MCFISFLTFLSHIALGDRFPMSLPQSLLTSQSEAVAGPSQLELYHLEQCWGTDSQV